MNKYDYIVAGAGAAGLSLLTHIINCGQLSNKKILLIDRAPKNQNDRTWCFWEKDSGPFESIVYKSWNSMCFYGDDGSSKLHDISPYRYKMIRGIDFYKFCFKLLEGQSNISVRYDMVESVFSSEHETYIIVNNEKIYSDYIFTSINHSSHKVGEDYFLWQHFKGWFIHTEKKQFNPAEATLMDFSINQHNDTRFVYVMPFSETEALVEYTVFSDGKLSNEAYNSGLEEYCEQKLLLSNNEYAVTSEEFGMIPMTNHKFPVSFNNIYYIGGAGGKTKASSGYTFRNIQKHSEALVNALKNNNTPHIQHPEKKFSFYDSVLLKILVEKRLPGSHIFTKLFGNNKMSEVFKFLDDETSIAEDLKLISSLPKSQFISAAFSYLIK
jgi:lycopene beta-cyclase